MPTQIMTNTADLMQNQGLLVRLGLGQYLSYTNYVASSRQHVLGIPDNLGFTSKAGGLPHSKFQIHYSLFQIQALRPRRAPDQLTKSPIEPKSGTKRRL